MFPSSKSSNTKQPDDEKVLVGVGVGVYVWVLVEVGVFVKVDVAGDPEIVITAPAWGKPTNDSVPGVFKTVKADELAMLAW